MNVLTRGATRADGRRFWAYEKYKGGFREKWYNPAAFQRAVDGVADACRLYRQRHAAIHYGTIRSACGHTAHHLTTSTNAVTCSHCKKWIKQHTKTYGPI